MTSNRQARRIMAARARQTARARVVRDPRSTAALVSIYQGVGAGRRHVAPCGLALDEVAAVAEVDDGVCVGVRIIGDGRREPRARRCRK
jgi:hypothetical protein